MKHLLLILNLALFAGMTFAEPREVSFETEDGVVVFGDWYSSGADKGAPVILLFHQGGGDARGEYADIAPRLVANGFHVLAIDQRNGGEVFQSTNRTIGHMGADYVEPGYCDAYPDLVAALRYVRKHNYKGKLIAWGSSYSAALVFRLAADYHQRSAACSLFHLPLGRRSQTVRWQRTSIRSKCRLLHSGRRVNMPSSRWLSR